MQVGLQCLGAQEGAALELGGMLLLQVKQAGPVEVLTPVEGEHQIADLAAVVVKQRIRLHHRKTGFDDPLRAIEGDLT